MSRISDEFFNAFSHGSGIRRECQCGRTHFASWVMGFEQGELEDLEAKAEHKPDRYLEHCDTSVVCVVLNGKDYVYECPCEGLLPYEQLIWNYREEILDYLTARHKQQLNVLKAFNSKLQQHAAALAEVKKVHVPE